MGVLAGCAAPQAEDAAVPKEPLFVDRTREVGLDFVHFNGMTGERYFVEMAGAGAALFDYDNDGDLDAYLVQGAMLGPGKTYRDAFFPPQGPLPPRDRLFRNDLVETGVLHFTDVTEAAGLDATGYGMGVAVGDFTNNGYPDLYVTNFESNQMFRNNGDGTFTDVTAAAGTDDERWSTSAAFFDYDRDGWLDLFVGNYVDFTLATYKACYTAAGAVDYCGPISYQPYPNRLFHNRGDGTFEEVSVASGINREYGGLLGVVVADFNGDDWPDLYLANDARANLLWIHQQNGRFENEALLSGVAFNEAGKAEGSMGVDAADFDGDGDEDLFMTHLGEETNTLYRNEGGGFFEDYTFEAGLGMPSRGFTGFGTAWLDYDNDGWLDVLIVNGEVRITESPDRVDDLFPLDQPNQLFRNLGEGLFEEVTEEAGAVFTLSEVSRGAAFGDVDNDGDTDVLVTNNSGPARLLINEVGDRKAWLGLRLVDRAGGSDAYGARVGCTLPDNRTLWRRVRAAASYCSSNDPRVLCGLGAARRIQAIEVRWPDGSREHWDGASFPLNRYYTLVKGTGQPLPPPG